MDKILLSDNNSNGDKLLLNSNGKLGYDFGCCCNISGYCILCRATDEYITLEEFAERDKSWAGLSPQTEWQCIRFFQGPDNITRPEGEDGTIPPGDFVFTRCYLSVACRLHETVWEIGIQSLNNPQIYIKPNEGSDNEFAGPWQRGSMFWYCQSGYSGEDCTKCRCYDPYSPFEDIFEIMQDPCGIFVPIPPGKNFEDIKPNPCPDANFIPPVWVIPTEPCDE